tara:strand:- start:8 stop:352 length:345 start_codon:yes stop_codon:yes gene_type:complete
MSTYSNLPSSKPLPGKKCQNGKGLLSDILSVVPHPAAQVGSIAARQLGLGKKGGKLSLKSLAKKSLPFLKETKIASELAGRIPGRKGKLLKAGLKTAGLGKKKGGAKKKKPRRM